MRFNLSKGPLGIFQPDRDSTVDRIGHLGDFNDLMLAGTLSGVEMGMAVAGVPFTRGGVMAALDCLSNK